MVSGGRSPKGSFPKFAVMIKGGLLQQGLPGTFHSLRWDRKWHHPTHVSKHIIPKCNCINLAHEHFQAVKILQGQS